MKVFSVVGVRKSGKTTVVTKLIKEFKKRGYRVGSTERQEQMLFVLRQEMKWTLSMEEGWIIMKSCLHLM